MCCCESNVIIMTTCPLSVRNSLVSFKCLQVHLWGSACHNDLGSKSNLAPNGRQLGPASGCALTRPGRSLLAPPNPKLVGGTRRRAESLKQSFGPKLLCVFRNRWTHWSANQKLRNAKTSLTLNAYLLSKQHRKWAAGNGYSRW